MRKAADRKRRFIQEIKVEAGSEQKTDLLVAHDWFFATPDHNDNVGGAPGRENAACRDGKQSCYYEHREEGETNTPFHIYFVMGSGDLKVKEWEKLF